MALVHYKHGRRTLTAYMQRCETCIKDEAGLCYFEHCLDCSRINKQYFRLLTGKLREYCLVKQADATDPLGPWFERAVATMKSAELSLVIDDGVEE